MPISGKTIIYIQTKGNTDGPNDGQNAIVPACARQLKLDLIDAVRADAVVRVAASPDTHAAGLRTRSET